MVLAIIAFTRYFPLFARVVLLPRFAASFAINRLMYTSGRDVDDCGG
ncbi:Uncharacterised protein [Raoultella ornithinolytica]|nr:Uncharacterised protein [Raoultella ornithinolytica]